MEKFEIKINTGLTQDQRNLAKIELIQSIRNSGAQSPETQQKVNEYIEMHPDKKPLEAFLDLADDYFSGGDSEAFFEIVEVCEDLAKESKDENLLERLKNMRQSAIDTLRI